MIETYFSPLYNDDVIRKITKYKSIIARKIPETIYTALETIYTLIFNPILT